MKRSLLLPFLTCLLTVGVMCHQARSVDPVLAEAPSVALGEIEGFTSVELPPSEAELKTLPSDTVIVKRNYTDEKGDWVLVSAVIGGRSKSSIHRPELCLPSQGYQMMRPRTVLVDGTEWRFISLERRDAPTLGFAYTFANQAGYRTSSHVKRIFRDILDRTFAGRIDRWVMVTVNSSIADDDRLSAFLENLREVLPR